MRVFNGPIFPSHISIGAGVLVLGSTAKKYNTPSSSLLVDGWYTGEVIDMGNGDILRVGTLEGGWTLEASKKVY